MINEDRIARSLKSVPHVFVDEKAIIPPLGTARYNRHMPSDYRRISTAATRGISMVESIRSSIEPRVPSAIEPRLGIDPRALGAFRIALGLLLLVDLVVIRLPDLHTFYTDAGVFPVSALADAYPTFASLSIHAVSGSPWVQGLLVAIAGCFAVFLLVGYRTRLSTAISLVLLASLHARNPHVVNGGDTILLTFLFLGLFLPLDARWSLDGVRSGGDQHRVDSRGDSNGHRSVFSLATAVVLLHVVSIYVSNAILKLQSDSWMGGTAVAQIFELEMYSAGLGPILAAYPLVLTAATWIWLALHVVALFLLLYTGWPRIALVAAFVAAHLGMALTMRIGIFPFVMIAGLLLFLPSPVWDRLDERVTDLVNRGQGLLESGRSHSFDRVIEWTDVNGRPETEHRTPSGERTNSSMTGGTGVRRGRRVVWTALLVGFLLTSVLWQASVVGVVDASPSAIDEDLADGDWAFFAPNPPDASSWYVVEATRESDETIDPTTDDTVTFDRPPDVAGTYPSILWKRFGYEMRFASETQYEPTAVYVCQNVDHDVAAVTIYHVQQPVASDGPVDEPIPDKRITTTC